MIFTLTCVGSVAQFVQKNYATTDLGAC